jgi:transcriptional regulator with XRE-family HTH domain
MDRPQPQSLAQSNPQPRPGLHALRAYRARHGLSQHALARALGVTNITISRWENGARRIDDRLLARVAQTTGIARDVLRPDLAALLLPRSVS